MQAGAKNAYESVKAFSETDFTQDLKKIDIPTGNFSLTPGSHVRACAARRIISGNGKMAFV